MPAPARCAPEVAKAYVTELRDVIRSLGVSDVRMEQGSLRCDVNTSLNRPGEEWGTRTETKNVNSLRIVERAVRSEIDPPGRACSTPAAGSSRRPGTSTRTPATPRPGRSKETATDYRYFPEPDLVPLAPDAGLGRASCKAALPELPRVHRRAAAGASWGLSDLDMQSIVNAGAVELIEATVAAGAPAGGGPQVVAGRAGPARQRDRRRAGRRSASRPAQVARAAAAGRRRASSTTSWPGRCSRACSAGEGDAGRGHGRARPRRSSPTPAR